MARLTALRGHRRVGVDSSVFIYLFEGDSRFARISRQFFQMVESASVVGITSTVTLMEVSVGPLMSGQLDRSTDALEFVSNMPNLRVVDVTAAVARQAASLRARHRLASADALQIAACLEHGATAFVTNDQALRRVTELQVVLLSDLG